MPDLIFMAQRKSKNKTSFGKKTDAESSYKKDRFKKKGATASWEKRPFERPSPAGRQRFKREGNPEGSGAGDKAPRRSFGNEEREGSRPFKKRDGFTSSPARRRFSDGDRTGKPFGKRTGFDPSFEKKPGLRRSDFTKRPSEKATPTEAPAQNEHKERRKPDKPFVRKDQFERRQGKDRFDKGNAFARPGKGPSFSARSSAGANPRKSGKPYSGFARKAPRKTTTSIHQNVKKEDGLTRLNKYIANSGMGSRREADEMIKMGLISVNGTVITEMGFKVKEGDVVKHEDKVLKAEKLVYVLLNKPKGFITTTADPQERKTVMNLVASACKERIYPVGRLDRNTTGLLLLTNDGDLADKLTHPSYKAKKIYKVELDRPLTKNDFQKIADGVHLEEGKAMVDDLAYIDEGKKSIGIELHIGWNRVVRRIFESLDYEVVKLDRVMYAGLDKKDLPRGEWRFLKPEEVVTLKHLK